VDTLGLVYAAFFVIISDVRASREAARLARPEESPVLIVDGAM
jgi:hypothetical protein